MKIDTRRRRVNLKYLKENIPNFSWTAIRDNDYFCRYTYKGVKNGVSVTLRRYSQLVDPGYDDETAVTVWYVDDGNKTQPLDFFILEQRVK